MLGFDIQEQHDIINHVLMITAKFGVASGCAIVYLAHSSLFPAMYAASALGVCQFFPSVFIAIQPFLGGLSSTMTIIIFTVITGQATLMSFGL